MDQGFYGRPPDPNQRIACELGAAPLPEQADQGENRRFPEQDKRLRRSRPDTGIRVPEPRNQRIDGGDSEIHDLQPSLQRNQVDDLLLYPRGNPVESPEDQAGPHARPGVQIAERFDKRPEGGVANPGERGHRSGVAVAVLAEERNEGTRRRGTDADQGVDGFPVKTVPAAPDEFDKGRDSLMRPEPAQNLDGALPDCAGCPLEQRKNRGYGRPPDGDERICRRRSNGIVSEGIHERTYGRREADLAERRRSLPA
ncbi:hypothetical protein DSECCO2_448100 [anaerobic digester metagenome]